MSNIITSTETLPEQGIFKVDRIGDSIKNSCKPEHVIDTNDLAEAMKRFEQDEFAYALRMVSNKDRYCESSGHLIAYKQASFPIDLPFLRYLAHGLEIFQIPMFEDTPETCGWLKGVVSSEFEDFYVHFPELLGGFQYKVYMHLQKMRFAAMQLHGGTFNKEIEKLEKVILDHIDRHTVIIDGEKRLKPEYCSKFLNQLDDTETESEYVEEAYSLDVSEMPEEFGPNVTCRKNVIQAVESMFWDGGDYDLIHQQLKYFQQDLRTNDLDNPMVYLEDANELLSIQHPGELFYYILMDDLWVRHFVYWLFYQYIFMYNSGQDQA